MAASPHRPQATPLHASRAHHGAHRRSLRAALPASMRTAHTGGFTSGESAGLMRPAMRPAHTREFTAPHPALSPGPTATAQAAQAMRWRRPLGRAACLLLPGRHRSLRAAARQYLCARRAAEPGDRTLLQPCVTGDVPARARRGLPRVCRPISQCHGNDPAGPLLLSGSGETEASAEPTHGRPSRQR